MDQELLIRRLSLPRFLYRAGAVALDGSGPYAFGLATRCFKIPSRPSCVSWPRLVGSTSVPKYRSMF